MRPALPWSVRRRVWDRIRAGDAAEVAGPAVGVSANTAKRWIREAGGVNPFPLTPPAGRYLTFKEREDIAVWSGQRVSMREIGRRLGRSASTISRELGKPTGQGDYRASVAQNTADQVRHRRRPERVKLLNNPRVRAEVEAGLKARRSPEQIAGRLVLDFPDDPEMRVSTETIYQSLYVQARGGLKQELTRHLRTGRVMRHPQRKGGERRGRIPGMVMIADRPDEADDRSVPGHWEGDLIKGSVSSNSAIGTLVERSSGVVLLLHLPDGYTADKVQEEAVRVISTLPTQLRRSLTWDQGTELTNHVQIAAVAGIDIYFCDPHSPWQRGSNENTNGLLRQYFPKSTDLSVHDRATLDLVTIEMNSRPRKRHGYLTPPSNSLSSSPKHKTRVLRRQVESAPWCTVVTMGDRLPIHEIAERWSRMSKQERKAFGDRASRVFYICCLTLLAITVIVPPLFGNNELLDAIRAFFASNYQP